MARLGPRKGAPMAGGASAPSAEWPLYRAERLEGRVLLSGLSIAQENALPGAPPSQWVLAAADPSIEGFTTDISVNQGQTVQFKINDKSAAPYHIDIYRLGYYSGLGARLVTTIPASATVDEVQPAPLTDATTGLTDAGDWDVTASWPVPQDATSGIYQAKIVRDDTGGANRIIFIVRADSSHSDLLFQTSDETWQAYNTWGGHSLYIGATPAAPDRGVAVSYNRPLVYPEPLGASVFWEEYPMVRWLDANGYDVSYFSDVDSDRNGALIKNHRVFLSVGHDEYWSPGQRANVEAARDAGVNLAFFSGNEVFWQTHWENSSDSSATPYRTLVCYKETRNDIRSDPLSPTVWTGAWADARQPGGADPQNALTGTLFSANGTRFDSITVPADDGQLRFWRNTSIARLAPGQTATLPIGELGYEWDSDSDNGFRPAGLIDLSHTTIQLAGQKLLDFGAVYGAGTATHSLTLYRAASGALVFGAGTINWSWGLDATHGYAPTATSPDMQQATVNLFADMGVQPATLQSGLTPATASTDTVAPTSVILSPLAGATLPSGDPVTIGGTASDSGGGVVAGVEVSVDGGASWHPATGRSTWSYVWSPAVPGVVGIRTRAVDDSGNLETPSAGVAVTVVAPDRPLSIWGDSAAPLVPSVNSPISLELGLKFRSDIDGYITALRFYKGPLNTGPHVGYLWDAGGHLLASAAFSSETPAGWQQVSFPSAVPITANTTYVASYYTASGNYSVDNFALATTAVSNGPLHALSSWQSAGNGVFAYGRDFPTASIGTAENFWVDIVFSSDPAVGGPAVVTEDPASGGTGAALTTAVRAVFNEAIDPSTVLFQVSGPSGMVAGNVRYDQSTHTATWAPLSPLDPSTTYSVSVSQAKDAAGRVMPPASWSFTTFGSGPYSLWPSSAAPARASTFNPLAVSQGMELGILFRADVAGYITGVRFYKAKSASGDHLAHLWDGTGNLLATAQFTNETASGWQDARFAAPVPLRADTTYVASYHDTSGWAPTDLNYFSVSGWDSPPLHVQPRPGGVYAFGQTPFPSHGYADSNYWVDVDFVPGTPLSAAAALPPITAAGRDYTFSITYSDPSPIDPSTLTGSNLLVTGPNGFSQAATLVAVDSSTPGSPRTATYRIRPPSRLWMAADDGNYTVALQPSQISDTAGRYAPPMSLGTFTVTAPSDITGALINASAPPAAGAPAGLAGWTVYIDANNNGIRDPGEPAATTNINGRYAFANLAPGTYTVVASVPANWQITSGSPAQYTLVLGQNQNAAGNDFSLSMNPPQSNAGTGSITGSVYMDANYNGVRDASEGGLAGWTVFLDFNADRRLDPGDIATVTDAAGNYQFLGLAPGTYTVRQAVPSGFHRTRPVPESGLVTVSAGQTSSGPAFGNVAGANIVTDFSYLVTLGRHYSQTGTIADGDLNGDGKIDFSDLVLLARNYRQSLDSVPAALQPADVAATAATPAGLLASPALLPHRRKHVYAPAPAR